MATKDISNFKDIETLRKSIGVLPSPFASDPYSRENIPVEASATNELSLKTGFPLSYTRTIIKESEGTGPDPDNPSSQVPFAGEIDSTARVITRRQVNAIGNLGTQEQFFEQCGGYHTFDKDICTAIGGYPEGAVLRFYDESTNTLRTVKSLKNNNEDNFLEDRGYIGSLQYVYDDEKKVSWVYMDNNPEVGISVDYSDFIDLSDVLLINNGLPDLYEVPYDSFLQLWALGYLECESLLREPQDDWEYLIGQIQSGDGWSYINESFNGTFTTMATGRSYIDVYNVDNFKYSSSVIGGYFPYQWMSICQGMLDPSSINNYKRTNLKHLAKICPMSIFSCSMILKKGDKIRIRHECYDKVSDSTLATNAQRMGHIKPRLFTSEELRQTYVYKFANLYKRGYIY